MPIAHLIKLDKLSAPSEIGIYFFRGNMILSNGDREEFEDWLQFTGTSIWMFGNEQPLSIDEFAGDWFFVDVNLANLRDE